MERNPTAVKCQYLVWDNVDTTAMLRSGRWRVAAKDGVPPADQETPTGDRRGLAMAAFLDEEAADAKYRVVIGHGRPFGVGRWVVEFNPNEFVEDSIAENEHSTLYEDFRRFL